MGQRKVSQEERELIYLRKQAGQTLQEIAENLGISYLCVRKWWRRYQKEGLVGLLDRKRGRPTQGVLSQFPQEVREMGLDLKRKHKRWGANRVRIELQNTASLQEMAIPSRSRFYAYFRVSCPDCLNVWTRHKKLPEPPEATAVHEMWQVDHQEGHHLSDGGIATVCSIRDPYGAAMIASQAFEVRTVLHWRKLTWQEVRQVLRSGFTEWQTLPDSVQTDNEMGLGGNPNDPFPSWLSLYLAGLGIKHLFIRSHCPTDQPQIERNHRTLDGLTTDEQSRQNVSAFQHAIDQERFLYNHQFPSRASDCDGRPPLQAHPALLTPRRPYHPAQEWALFSMQRVFDFLATFTFDRKANSNGVVTLKGLTYTVGLQHAGKAIRVRLDPIKQEWMFFELNPLGQEVELRRQPLRGLDFISLTGLQIPENPQSLSPIQLTLPLAA
jgi:transposase